MVVSRVGKAVPALTNNRGVGVRVGVNVGVIVGVWVTVGVKVGVRVGVELDVGVMVAVAVWLGGVSVGAGPQADTIKIRAIEKKIVRAGSDLAF
jgi:hypothetical protein